MSLEEMEKDVTSRDGERCHLKRWRKMSLEEMEEDVTRRDVGRGCSGGKDNKIIYEVK